MSKLKIVAIDDEPDFIATLKDYFSLRGYDIDVALRGATGIELVKDKKPNVVLMDLKMPGIDGDEVLKLIRSMNPSPKVIFITAYDDGGKTRARLLDMGAYAYFDKPVVSLKLLEVAVNKASQS